MISGFFVANSAQANILEVNGVTGDDAIGAPYKTIQAAINAAATTGDTINVAAGTYAESVIVNKGVSIIGVGETTLIAPATDQNGFTITAAEVTIQDLKITLQTSGIDAQAIKLEGADSATISGNIIETAGNKGIGVWVGGVGFSNSNNLTISNNTIIIADASTGIYAEGGSTAQAGWSISGNTITANNGNPLELYDVTNSTVNNNTLTTTVSGGSNVMWFSELASLESLVFTNNTLNGSSGTGSQVAIGTDFRDAPLDPSNAFTGSITTVTITGNTFSNWGTRALRLGRVAGTGNVTGIAINTNIFNMTVDTEVIGGPATDKTGTGNTFNVNFPAKIQKAIDNAFASDTVNVAAGTYTENVNINKTVTLIGAGSAAVTVTATNPAVSVFNVTANSVNISGFTVTGANVSTTAGIYLGAGVTGSNIHDNILTGNGDGMWLGAGSNHNTITNNNVSNNLWQGFEVYISNDNTFTDNSANSNTNYGFKIDSGDNNEFANNIANSNGKWGFYVVESGGGATNTTFSGNTANLNTQYGIRINGGNGYTLTGNTFDANISAGLRLKENITNFTVNSNNNITNSPIGIDIDASVTDVTSWTVSNNNISGNTTGVSNLGTGILNATQNWWGSFSGPKHSSNPSGTGDEVSSNVTFSKWCSNLACTEFGSNGALAGYMVSTSPADSVVLPNSITLTIKAVDTNNAVLVNNSSDKVSLTADRGAAFGSNLLSFSNGVISTAISNTISGLVNVLVSQVGGSFTATKQLSFNLNDSANLAVTQTSAIRSFATADGTFENGWKWVFDITVPTDETTLQMKFGDWISGSNHIDAANNIRFYSAQSSDVSDASNAIVIDSANAYGGAMSLADEDLDSSKAGRQIQITVEAQVPNGSAGGSYSTSYGIQTTVE